MNEELKKISEETVKKMQEVLGIKKCGVALFVTDENKTGAPKAIDLHAGGHTTDEVLDHLSILAVSITEMLNKDKGFSVN